MLALTTSSGPKSSYVCARVLPYSKSIPLLQHAGTLLDCGIVIIVAQLIKRGKHGEAHEVGKRHVAIGWAFTISSTFLALVGLAYYVSQPEDRHWITTFTSTYAWSSAKLAAAAALTTVCGLHAISRVGLKTASVVVVFTCTYTISLAWAWSNSQPFPPIASRSVLVSLSLALLGLGLHFNIETASEDRVKPSVKPTFTRVPAWFYLLLITLFVVRGSLWFSKSSYVSYHPIDLLIFDAKFYHEAWRKQASSGKQLEDAWKNYRTRYNRVPPPGFDEWYRYATSRSSLVVDDFDSIYRDLQPFWDLAPAEIRQRTWEIISNPWNDIAGISVRNGKADISPNVMPTHRWMLDGLVNMIDQFAKWLPDMDLAFNLNDECRVAVPFSVIESMRKVGQSDRNPDRRKDPHFSNDRAAGWTPIPEAPNTESRFKELSFQRTFYEFGAVGCPPNSSALRNRLWNTNTLCTTCTYPHSLGQFVSDWTLLGNICHQPDIANLHGFYLSPAASKASHELMPVFSQSKVHGYNDILYPSAWNYMDKAKYDPGGDNLDPPFKDKDNVLFWRGATSEGVSPGSGTWKGMTRQRMVHLSNNLTTAQHVLLPYPTAPLPEKLAYVTVTPTELKTLLNMDVAIVDRIVRCGGRDCPDQDAEFGLVQPTDFQSHWRYKYLLDLDGAGFSGRFLPFLQSRSLPFKAALFREWYDSRLTPWLHFVPLDLRLHGVWDTLAYFAGMKGNVGGRDVLVKRRDKEGELIAERGREWAEKVLRKEDMEIYFFRLLLEWGRLTDDRRDELGLELGLE
ncbi:hypothetical protein BJ546DRAFT_946709 [Cryomyces antarcticus]